MAKSSDKKPRRKILDLEEMKRNKPKAVVYIVLRVITVGVAVFSAVRGHWESTGTCLLTLLLMMIPSFIDHRLKISLPTVMEIIMIIFVFVANILGEIAAVYESFPLLDTILHTLNGFVCAGVGFGLIDILNSDARVSINLSPLFVCLFSFCFSMTAGVVWEFFEFGMDMVFATDMQKDAVIHSIHSVLLTGGGKEVTHLQDITDAAVNGSSLGIGGYLDIGLIDTMKDMIVNFIGAVVFNTLGYFYLKGRGRLSGIVRNFIPVKREEDRS